ncbi:Peptidase M50 [Fimbriimonas ginsengisoli Gsoil 348]|uniref:Zinc metalloprotease n=2 Tax=Fimbriimonas ginsengisoli TaxID=1005039 RepID=A0A068NPW4_FIMGI|nr:Peptidase M50 [Fimbriimonas ginsengisoli Gsoil 348]
MSVAGIPIRIHFTFVLFLVWIATIGSGFLWTGLVLAVFACVLLHELGHALVARRFGIETRDITLYPIGGVAMLDGRPRPRQELWISLAGPMVNVVLAIILALVLLIRDGALPSFSLSLNGSSFLGALFVANVSLAIFNMIPAFPMDGGRVLRGSLALAMPETRATQIAGTIGQGLAILIGLWGILHQSPILVLVAFFVFLGAGQEVSATITRSFLAGHALHDAMQKRYRTINSGATLEAAARMLIEGSQHDFPVVAGDEGEVIGVLTRNAIAHGLATEGPTGYVAAHMRREYKTAHPNAPLEAAIEMFSQEDPSPIIVLDDGQMVGMVTQDNLSEFIMLEHARQQGTRSYGYTG